MMLFRNPMLKPKRLRTNPKLLGLVKALTKKADTAKAKRIASMKRLKESGHVDDSVALFEDFVEL